MIRTKEKFQLSFPEATQDESWCLLSLKVLGGGGDTRIIALTLNIDPSLYSYPLLLSALGSAPEISSPFY